MNIDLHITLCVVFIFSTWVYFLKCEINELRRRVDERAGDHAHSTASELTASSSHETSLPTRQLATDARKPVVAHAGAASPGRQSGIPT